VVLILSLLVIAAGIYAAATLNLELLPRIEFPQTVVVAQWLNAESADQFLSEVTVPLEQALSEVDGVVNVESTTTRNFAFIILRNEFGLNQDRIVEDIEAATAQIDLPEGVEPPQVLNFSLGDLPVVVASASSSDLSLAELKQVVSAELEPRLEALEQVSQVTVSGGQELPEEGVATPPEADAEALAEEVEEEIEDPGRLPLVMIEGAKSMGIEVEYAQDVTPEFLAGVSNAVEDESQVLIVLQMIPPEILPYAPPETLALLPQEYVGELDPALQQELSDLAGDLGFNQYALSESVAMLRGEPVAEAPAKPTQAPESTAMAEPPALELEPLALPESWITAAAQAGQDLTTTADLSSEVVGTIVNFAPEVLIELEPSAWRVVEPDVLAIALPALAEQAEPEFVAELQAIQLAGHGVTPEPVPLPESWVQMAEAAGFELESTADVNPEAITMLSGAAPQLLDDLDAVILFAFTSEVLAALPESYVVGLDEGLQETLTVIAVRAGQSVGEEMAETEEPQIEPVPLPETWIVAAAQAGQELATTADLTPEIMGFVVDLVPQMLVELEPAAWRAVSPESLAVVIPTLEEKVEEELLGQLRAIQLAGQGEAPEPAQLPDSWLQLAATAGFALETTADITPEAIPLLVTNAPQLLDDLNQEMILALAPDVLAALPDEYVGGLDEGLKETLAIITAHRSMAAEVATDVEEVVTEEPTATPDPARLPDLLIQGAQGFGIELEYAYDITPEFMRQVSAFGPQGLQILTMMMPGNLMVMQPEVIALLPAEFVEGLDADLRAELDELATEFGGAGQLAIAEAEEASEAETDEVATDAPALTGPWLEPGPDGAPSQFQTAADLIDNPFVPGAAMLLNFFPNSPQVEDPIPWMQALTPEILGYLAENEEGFVANLSPVILEMMSPEALTFLLEDYGDEFAADVAQRLAGIAAGTVTAFVPEASITRTDGDPSVVLNLFKDGDANTVEVAHRVFDELDAYQEENPEISFSLVFEQATLIEESIEGVTREGILGAIFAVLVVLVFLSGRVHGKYKLSWRATLVVGVSIPLSVFTAFLLMRLVPPTMGTWLNNLAEDTGIEAISFFARLFPTSVTLNIMTLSGLTVAVGRVVDDSIVVLENTYRYIQKGDDTKTSALEGTREVAIAIFSSTLTTVAVFLPLGLFGGLIGSFFLPFGLTVTYALLASFFVAISVVPALAYLLINKDQIPEERETGLQRRYSPILKWALGHRGLTMLIATLIFAASLFLLRGLPQSFIPEIGEPTVNVTVEMPNGTQMAETDLAVSEFEQTVLTLAGVETVQSEIGSAGGFESFFGGGGVSQNVANITISAESPDELDQLTDEVRTEAENVFGLENAVVSAASQTGFGGFSLIVTGNSMEELTPVVDDVKDILASLDQDENDEPDLRNISSSIDQAAVDGNQTIIRIDGQPAMSFSAELDTADTIGVTRAAKQAVSELGSLPAGAEVTEGFESEQQTQGFQEMISAIAYSIVIVYIILALTFRSLVHPFTILFSLPFALVGAALALWLSGSVLGISAMIGLMMLVGVVVTNAIVLLELVQQLRERGNVAYDALMQGGRTRLRPIWMTALAAALALTPLALSQESGAIIAAELAIVVIGGLIISTALTLVVVPVVYSLFDDAGSKLRRRRQPEEAGA
jgi:HAE1 family hydrophobic/amphiphilic exporter-1